MWGNNETGVIQPVKDVSKEIKSINTSTLFHSDVVQGIISDNIDFHRTGIESAAVSAHKIGGPKGVGAMFINNKYGRWDTGWLLPARLFIIRKDILVGIDEFSHVWIVNI